MKRQPVSKLQNSAVRIEPLTVLPVFLNLTGKKALVIGNSVGALWKAELLLQSGAAVSLICCEPTQEVFQFVNRQSGMGLEISRWQEISLEGAFVVIADVPEAETADLALQARAAGAMFNAVDRPEYCQFQFGSIVNKSPLVIGISTGGAAPVLAQIVRSLIEAALPITIQALARKAERIRKRINERIESTSVRREYWNRFFCKALGSNTLRQDKNNGPYSIDKDFVDDLTLHDLRMLRQAECVYFLPGSNRKIGTYARREARQYFECRDIVPKDALEGSVLVTPSSGSAYGRELKCSK